MAASNSVLSGLVKQYVHDNMAKLPYAGYGGPLDQGNPSYYVEFCTAIGSGIADGSKVITLKSEDKGKGGGPPIPGVGAGVGIFVDRNWFNKKLYDEIYAEILKQFGRTLHDPWFPKEGNSGQFLHAVTKGISDAIADHYTTAYKLIGKHPLVYQGVGLVKKGMYSGLSPSAIEGLIMGYAPRFKGVFWPIVAKVVARVYVEAIHMQSTGTLTITGSCKSSPSQVCGVNKTGFGNGTAI
jgi:hypothetical protein